MICLPNSKDISGVDTSDTATPSPRAEILPGMNAAAQALLNAKKPKPMNLFEKVTQKVWQLWGKRNVRYGTYGVAGLAAILVGRKLLKK
jgi:hypothetical protein